MDKWCEQFLENTTPTSTGCRIWNSGTNNRGYASVKVNGVPWNAHRYIGLSLAGRLDADSEVEVIHTCDSPACLEPTHLGVADTSTNMQDCYSKDRHRVVTRGEGGINAKLTEAQVIEIRDKYEQRRTTYRGPGTVQLAHEYGVSASMISRIVNRKNWTHI